MAKRSTSTDLMNLMSIAKRRRREPYWSVLPADLLGLILDRLPILDRLRFRAVCRGWLLAAAENPYSPAVNPCPPWLLFHRRHSRTDRKGNCAPYLYNLSEKKEYPVDLSRLRGLRCIGSSGCWLVALDRSSDLHLVNPLTGTRLSLPSLAASSDLTFNKVLVVDSWVFVVLGHGGTLAYARAGVDESWTQPEHRYRGDGFGDIAVHEGKLYGTLYLCGTLVLVADLTLPLQTTRRYLSKCVPDVDGEAFYSPTRFYLVRSADGKEVMLVKRHYPSTAVAAFLVFRLLDSRWVRVEDLGDDAIFLGENQSFAVSTRDLPELRGNCVYFTEVGVHSRVESLPVIRDAGVFSLRDGSISPCYHGQFATTFSRFSRFPPHIWLSPSLQ